MKNWPIWLFVIGVVGIVLFAFNYQGKDDAVPLSEIFPEEDAPVKRVEYEFVDQQEQPAGETPAETAETVTQPPVKRLASPAERPAAPAAPQQVQAPAASPSAGTADFSQTPYTIQVLSSSQKASAETALNKVKAAGYPAYLQEVNIPDRGTWYRIYVGRFQTRAQADEYLTKVKKDYENSFVISPK